MTPSDKKNVDLDLIRNLIDLNGLSISKAADLMGIQRTNLSSWLNGKSNVFSTVKIDGMLESLGMHAIGNNSTGVRICYLSHDHVHRWHVDESSTALTDVLKATESNEALEWLEIFQVNASPKGSFNIIRRKSKSGDLYILVTNKNPSSVTYPISAENIGFGKKAGNISLPTEKWIAWLKAQTLPTSTFRNEISEYLDATNTVEAADESILKHQIEEMSKELKDSIRTNDGLRAVIRALLGEIRKLDKNNKMLDHQIRDDIFNEEVNKF